MSDCAFCVIPEIICAKIPAYCIRIPVPEKLHYLQYNIINISNIKSESDFYKMTNFTPGSRCNLSLDDANRLLAHRQAWILINTNNEPYGAVFENMSDIENNTIKIQLENLQLPKDWDIIKISENQYILNKHASRVLIQSTYQFHLPLHILLNSVEFLKVFNLNGEIIKPSK